MDSNGEGRSFKGEDGASTLLSRSRPVVVKLFDRGQVPCGVILAQFAMGHAKRCWKLSVSYMGGVWGSRRDRQGILLHQGRLSHQCPQAKEAGRGPAAHLADPCNGALT